MVRMSHTLDIECPCEVSFKESFEENGSFSTERTDELFTEIQT